MESAGLVSPSAPCPGGAGCSDVPVGTWRLGMLEAALSAPEPARLCAVKLLEATLWQLF